MKEQIDQVRVALQTAHTFQERNTALEEKLLQQKEEIEEYMKIVKRDN